MRIATDLIGGHKKNSTSHVSIMAWAICRDLALKLLLGNVRFLILAAITGCHLRREDAYKKSSAKFNLKSSHVAYLEQYC